MAKNGLAEAWSKPATKGELLQVLLLTKKMSTRILGAALAIKGGNETDYQKNLQEAFDVSREIDALWDQIGEVGGE